MTAFDLLGWTLVHSAWQVTVLACALALFARFGRAPARARYTAGYATLLLLVIVPLTTAVLLTAGDLPTSRGVDALTHAQRASAASPPVAVYLAIASAAHWIALAWLVGAATLFTRWCASLWLVPRLGERGTRRARAAWQAALEAAAARTGVARPVLLLESTAVDTPMVFGHRRPVMLVPVPAFEALGDVEAESVLAHELAHVQRSDFVANGVQTLVDVLLFFHPAARWVSRTVRAERELACDDVAVWAIGSRAVYARALARLEVIRSSTGNGRRLAVAASGGSLLERLERLADRRDDLGTFGARSRGAAALAAAGALVSLTTLGGLLVPPTRHAAAAATLPDRYTVRAQDPAGEFTITFERGRPTRATVGGVPVGRHQLVLLGDSLYLPWGSGGQFAVRLAPDGFTWAPRPRSPRT